MRYDIKYLEMDETDSINYKDIVLSKLIKSSTPTELWQSGVVNIVTNV